MSTPATTPFLAARDLGMRLTGADSDYDALIAMAEGKRFVLLGGATHGTQEFYRMRADITRRLVAELGFDAVAVEGDWPDAWRVNRYVQGEGDDDALSALDDFQRFPQWMWRNQDMPRFIGPLRADNAQRAVRDRVGFYGLDLYSLYRSADAVIAYLEQVDPEEAQAARRRYAALDHVREPQVYGYQAALGRRPVAYDGVVAQLLALQADAQSHLERSGLPAIDAQFFAERNAAVVVRAEIYFRGLFGGRVNAWNMRDAHMRDTLLALSAYRLRRGGTGRVVVWAHNAHLGDARATETHRRGEWNLGQLMRLAVGERALSVGFTTYTGRVAAAPEWGAEIEHMRVPPALEDSWEHMFHATGMDRFFLRLAEPAARPLREPFLERAIGALYLPESERTHHYFEASLAAQFDALFHLDETAALEPLESPGG